MIIYRSHRRNIYEALETAKEFKNIEDMKEYIVKNEYSSFPELFTKDDIVIDDQSFNDERIGWKDTHYVCLNRLGEKNYIEKYGCPQCIGFCAMNYDKNNKIYQAVCKTKR